jgi:hypothetical protein
MKSGRIKSGFEGPELLYKTEGLLKVGLSTTLDWFF